MTTNIDAADLTSTPVITEPTVTGGSTNARITHAVREVLRDGDPRVRITHAVREVLRDGDPRVRITHVVREVLRTVSSSYRRSSFFIMFS